MCVGDTSFFSDDFTITIGRFAGPGYPLGRVARRSFDRRRLPLQSVRQLPRHRDMPLRVRRRQRTQDPPLDQHDPPRSPGQPPRRAADPRHLAKVGRPAISTGLRAFPLTYSSSNPQSEIPNPKSQSPNPKSTIHPPYACFTPPSGQIVCPVINDASSEARNAQTSPISSMLAMRPSAWPRWHCSRASWGSS